MRAVILGAAIAVAASPALAAASNNGDIRAVVEGYGRATMLPDPTKSASYCEAGSTVVDEFAPHLWRGNGCAAWARDFMAMSRKEGIGACKLTVGAKGKVMVDGAVAYAVYPATVGCTRQGKPFADQGVWTFVMHKGGAGWKIASWSWSALP